MNELMTQPWHVQLILASGYAAYLLAFTGIRNHHGAVEVTFATFLFGLVTATSLALLPVAGHEIAAGMTAFAITCLFALVWRKYLCEVVFRTLHRWDVTWSNDDPSALSTLLKNNRYPVSAISIELDDGSWLTCDEPSKFDGAPFHPITVGPNGDVALYLTHVKRSGEAERELTTVRAADGDRINYIPAERIRQITMRHAPRN